MRSIHKTNAFGHFVHFVLQCVPHITVALVCEKKGNLTGLTVGIVTNKLRNKIWMFWGKCKHNSEVVNTPSKIHSLYIDKYIHRYEKANKNHSVLRCTKNKMHFSPWNFIKLLCFCVDCTHFFILTSWWNVKNLWCYDDVMFALTV